MNRDEFKKEYLTDAFYFVKNEDEFNLLQGVALEFGLKDPIGGSGKIAYDMHDVSKEIAPVKGVKVAKNLTIFPDNRFQQSDFWVRGASYGDPKSVEKFRDDYLTLPDLLS